MPGVAGIYNRFAYAADMAAAWKALVRPCLCGRGDDPLMACLSRKGDYMADSNNQTEEAREPHEHDAAAWEEHRKAQRQPYRQPG
ncbi:MAG TPA: hypothetical protein VK804_03245 [Bradyrhizobium sp.]|nr:hypothetical protein [Bradyrhizobium sp.]